VNGEMEWSEASPRLSADGEETAIERGLNPIPFRNFEGHRGAKGMACDPSFWLQREFWAASLKEWRVALESRFVGRGFEPDARHQVINALGAKSNASTFLGSRRDSQLGSTALDRFAQVPQKDLEPSPNRRHFLAAFGSVRVRASRMR